MPPADPTSVDRGLTAPQACAIVGITSRQLSWWTRTVLVDPATEPAPARRAQRQYSYADLVMLMVVKRLLDSGVVDGSGSVSNGDAPPANCQLRDRQPGRR